MAGKAVRVESVWKRRKAVNPGLPKVHRREEGSREATGVSRGRVGAKSRGVVEGVIHPEPG